MLASGGAIRNYRCAPGYYDLDFDGHNDLVLGEWYSSIRFYHNSGTNADPLFTDFINLVPPDPDSFRNGNPPRIAFTDWDGDTDIDLVTCDYYGWVVLRRNITPTGIAGREPLLGGGLSPTVLRHGPVRLPGVPEDAGLAVYDAAGNAVRNDTEIPPGAYFVRVTSPVGVEVRKVVVAR